MIPSLANDIGGYLHTVFVTKMNLAVLVGLIGQALFTARFIVQWLASERAGRSVIPIAFWFLSIGGGLLLLAYSLYQQDPVFILGQSLGTFIYLRNLMFVFREKRARQQQK